jgi:CysZ protein
MPIHLADEDIMTGFYQGAQYILQGFKLITQPGLRWFVIMPLLVNVIVMSLGIWLGIQQLNTWMDHLLPSWLMWLEWILWPLMAVMIFLAVFYTFSILANLIAAPFNALLAEQVEARLRGLPLPPYQGFMSLVKIAGRTFKSEISKLTYMLKWLIPVLLITFIPGVNLIAPVAWFVYGAWILAIEYIDYPMGNHELYFKDELQALKAHRNTSLGFGGLLSAIMIIPGFNFLAMPVGVAGATAFWVEEIATDYQGCA